MIKKIWDFLSGSFEAIIFNFQYHILSYLIDRGGQI
jgi:hypothetical protein